MGWSGAFFLELKPKNKKHVQIQGAQRHSQKGKSKSRGVCGITEVRCRQDQDHNRSVGHRKVVDFIPSTFEGLSAGEWQCLSHVCERPFCPLWRMD